VVSTACFRLQDSRNGEKEKANAKIKHMGRGGAFPLSHHAFLFSPSESLKQATGGGGGEPRGKKEKNPAEKIA